MDESILSDIRKGANNDNLSSISKYFKKGVINNNNYSFSFNNFDESKNNENEGNYKDFNANDDNNNEEENKLINCEIKLMLDEVVKYKTKAYNKFKMNRIEEAMREYVNVKFF